MKTELEKQLNELLLKTLEELAATTATFVNDIDSAKRIGSFVRETNAKRIKLLSFHHLTAPVSHTP